LGFEDILKKEFNNVEMKLSPELELWRWVLENSEQAIQKLG
jgi:hypothetical protein